MVMAMHDVQVGKLYQNAVDMKNRMISANSSGSTDYTLMLLGSAIDNLKRNWEGMDAGVRIQELIDVYNFIIQFRENLCAIIKDLADSASRYRNIQIVNGGTASDLALLTIEQKAVMQSHFDNRDIVNINPAADTSVQSLIDAKESFDKMIGISQTLKDDAEISWQMGPNRNQIMQRLNDSILNSNKHSKKIAEVTEHVRNALKNYH